MTVTVRSDTLVLQSHRRPVPAPWFVRCLDSVGEWAESSGFAYRFEGDLLFERLPADLRERTAAQPVVAADLARLEGLAAALQEGYRRVVWMDADTLVIDPRRLVLPEVDYALGREVWIQSDSRGRLRAYMKVHNAFLLIASGNPFLDFYRHAAARVVRAHGGAMVPQLVGPKLLTALHNLVSFPVVERAGVLPPAVARDLLAGGGPALALFRDRSSEPPAALNLCASLVESELSEAEVAAVIELLSRCAAGPKD